MQAAGSSAGGNRLTLSGLLNTFYAISGKLWSRAVVVVTRVLGSISPVPADREWLEPSRMRLMSRRSSSESVESELSFSTQATLAELRIDLENLEDIQRLVDEELEEPLSESPPLSLSQQDVLKELIRRGLWNLDALIEAIEFVDEDLSCHIENLLEASPTPPLVNLEVQTLRKSLLVMRALRLKIRVLKAEIQRLEALNPRQPLAHGSCARRVRFAVES